MVKNSFIKENKPILIFIGIVILIILYKNGIFFGINLQTEDVQFYNEDIVIPFTLSNFTNPTIIAYLNNVRLYEVLVYQENVSHIREVTNTTTNITTNETYWEMENRTINQAVGYTQTTVNGLYTIILTDVNSAGTLKITVTEGNITETRNIEIRQPYVNIQDNIPNLVDRDKIWDLEIMTLTPQGDVLEADSVDIDVYDPLNAKQTIFLDKSGNTFTKKFTFKEHGNYQFKIHARKEGYVTKEVTRITSVTKAGGIHPIIYVWIFGAVLWTLFLLIKLITTTKKR